MCGLIGYEPTGQEIDWKEQRDAFARLARESRIRGMHSYGIATPTMVLKSHDLDEVIDAFDASEPTIFHARYSTSGDWRNHENNQPIIIDATERSCRLALAFNGVIDMGTRAEMSERWDVRLETDNDGEIFLRRLLLGQSIASFVGGIAGSFAGVWLEGDVLQCARNARRPLWKCEWPDVKWLASTKDVFVRAGFAAENLREIAAT